MTQASIDVVADIGGTNIRLGIISAAQGVEQLKVYQCDQYLGLSEVLTQYFAETGIKDKSINACLAIACPVENDLISMTNLPWQFSKSALKAQLKLNKLLLINDYTAIAFAVPLLNEQQKVQIGGGEVVNDKPIAICGPGTGLGVAHVVPSNGHWLSLGGEGGHVDFAPVDEHESKILSYLLTKHQRVSYEQLLSGMGLEQIYQALMSMRGEQAQDISAQQISEQALAQSCEVCQQALAQFCKTLGSFAGNLALTMASFGGVYIAGGIVPRFIEYFENSEFRARFEAKGRFIEFNRTIPTFVITESQPGIIGACAYLRQHNTEEL
jgi:glucokinase